MEEIHACMYVYISICHEGGVRIFGDGPMRARARLGNFS